MCGIILLYLLVPGQVVVGGGDKGWLGGVAVCQEIVDGYQSHFDGPGVIFYSQGPVFPFRNVDLCKTKP
jgi:hypothetical protein